MNNFRTSAFRAFALALALPATALVLAGCDVGSTDSTTAVPSDDEGKIYNYSGLYMSISNENGSTNGFGTLVFPAQRQSGVKLIWLRLLQYGSVLEAYDNAGLTWSGDISVQNGEVASFSLQGRTTAGSSVEIFGTLDYDDTSRLSTMDAAWIEPSFAGSIFAQATVSPVVTNSPSPTNNTGDVTLTATSYNASSNEVITLTASGGSTYTWSSVTYGTLVPSGSIAAYTRTSGTATNHETITVSSDGDSDSVTIEFD